MEKNKIFLFSFLFFLILTFSLLLLFFNSQKTLNKVNAAQQHRNLAAPTHTPTITIPNSPTPSKNLPKPNVKRVEIFNIQPSDFIINKVNEYRLSLGLTKVTTKTETCNFAIIRAKEISNDFTHNGFNKRVNEKSLPYSTYHEVTENIAYNTNYKNVVDTWINSPGHAENMRKNTPYACIGQFGDYYSYEGWMP